VIWEIEQSDSIRRRRKPKGSGELLRSLKNSIARMFAFQDRRPLPRFHREALPNSAAGDLVNGFIDSAQRSQKKLLKGIRAERPRGIRTIAPF
jgi:hypothetical protein